MSELGHSLVNCGLLTTLKITKCNLQQDDVQPFLLDCFRGNKYELRCLDLSKNYVFADNLITSIGDNFVYFMVNEEGEYLSTKYIQEVWSEEIFELLHAHQFRSIMFFKQKNKTPPKMTLGRSC